MDHATLLISCSDQKGITAGITNFVYENNGNILHADQHIDEQCNTFFMRIEWDLKGFALNPAEIENSLEKIAGRFQMEWSLFFSGGKSRVAVFVSKPLHCLQDILFRYGSGQFVCEIPLIVSNHPDAKGLAEANGIPYYQFPVTAESKKEVEAKQRQLLRENNVDLIVLARYHQILTEEFISEYRNRIINIHHSFLPAFVGKDPYGQAFQKGVKVIGATSHYVTKELDQGPIIEQDTVRVSHRDTLSDIVRKGQDLERVVLTRALCWQLEHKVLCYGNKTVVFD